MLAMIRSVYQRVKDGAITGLMIVAELPEGAYHCSVSSTRNVAERIGRLELLKDDVKASAIEDGVS